MRETLSSRSLHRLPRSSSQILLLIPSGAGAAILKVFPTQSMLCPFPSSPLRTDSSSSSGRKMATSWTQLSLKPAGVYPRWTQTTQRGDCLYVSTWPTSNQSFFQGGKFPNFLLPSTMELLLSDRATKQWSSKPPVSHTGRLAFSALGMHTSEA